MSIDQSDTLVCLGRGDGWQCRGPVKPFEAGPRCVAHEQTRINNDVTAPLMAHFRADPGAFR